MGSIPTEVKRILSLPRVVPLRCGIAEYQNIRFTVRFWDSEILILSWYDFDIILTVRFWDSKILILSWYGFYINHDMTCMILILPNDCFYSFRMPACDISILSWYFEILILSWWILFWYYQMIVDISFVCQLTVIFWYYRDILRLWYYHDMILILSNDCWCVFRMPAYGDILMLSWYYFDI